MMGVKALAKWLPQQEKEIYLGSFLSSLPPATAKMLRVSPQSQSHLPVPKQNCQVAGEYYVLTIKKYACRTESCTS